MTGLFSFYTIAYEHCGGFYGECFPNFIKLQMGLKPIKEGCDIPPPKKVGLHKSNSERLLTPPFMVGQTD